VSTFLVLAWLAAVDGGVPKPPPPKLSAEDAELLKHLEVLEAMDEVKDLELLEELSVER
jgi:hypothetical protein